MKPNIKKRLKEALKPHDGPFAALMSGGIDSHAVLFSLLELGKKVHCYSFTLDDRESRDFRAAKNTAAALSLPFTPIVLSTDIKKLKKDVKYLVQDLGLTSKAAIESLWGLSKAVDASKQPFITSGLAAGLYFVETKSGCMHYKNRTDEYRAEKWPKAMSAAGQTAAMIRHAQKRKKTWISPFLTRAMFNEFQGTTWEQLNQPKLKQPMHDQFASQLEQVRVYAPQSLQLGDSGISDLFKLLLEDDEWNQWGYKSTSGIFNRVAKGEL